MAGFPDTAACLGQSVCESQTGSKGTVALRPKYSVARRGAAWCGARQSNRQFSQVFQHFFSSFYFLVAAVSRKFRKGIQRWYHSIPGENEIVSTVFKCTVLMGLVGMKEKN